MLIVAAGLAEAFLTATGIQAPADSWIRIPTRGVSHAGGDALSAAVPARQGRSRARLPPLVRAARHAGGGHRARAHGARTRRRRLHRRAGSRPHDLRARRRAGATHGRRGCRSRAARAAGVRGQPQDRRRRWPTAGLLLNKPGDTLRHQYPCCWRCKNPIIFRATEQWFARLGDGGRSASRLRAARAGRDRAHAVDPDLGREPHPRHDRGAPRLVPVAPARCGACPSRPFAARAAGMICSTPRLSSTWRRSSRATARTPGSRGRPRSCCRRRHHACRLRQAAVGEAARHRRRLVRVGRVVGGRRRGQAACPRARRSTSIWRAPTSTAAGSTRRC